MQVIRWCIGVLANGCNVASVLYGVREMWQSAREKDDARFRSAILQTVCFSFLTGVLLFSGTFSNN